MQHAISWYSACEKTAISSWFHSSIQQILLRCLQNPGAIIKAILHYSVSESLRKRIQAQAPEWLDLVAIDVENRDVLEAEIRDAEVLLHVLSPVDASMMAIAPRLRLIQNRRRRRRD